MFNVNFIKPGTYRAYRFSDGQSDNLLNLFVVFRVIDGKVKWDEPAPTGTWSFDDDLDRSSIYTGPLQFGDHDCRHHSFKSNGVLDLHDERTPGLSRTRVSDWQDQVVNAYGKAFYDSHGWNGTEWTYSGPATYVCSRSSTNTHFERHWVGYNGNRWDEIRDVNFTFASDHYTVDAVYDDIWNGQKRSSSYHWVYDVPYTNVYGPNFLDFTVTKDDIDAKVYLYRGRWIKFLDDCPKYGAPPPEADVFGACLQAAMDFNAYDVNLIEALAGFSGIDDLVPVGLSKDLAQEVSAFLESPSLITALTKGTYLAASTFLYSKYVTANNIADLEQLLGLSGSKRFAEASVIAEKLALSLTDNQQADWDFRMAKMAQKIVYKWDYRQDSYGGITSHASNATSSVTTTSRAHLCATPGPLRDMTAAGIILDDIGLSLRASRLAQTVKLEFVANWFIPIEDSLDRIEFNSAHLNQLYNVQKLTYSTKTVTRLDTAEILPIYGLGELSEASVTITDYNRHTTDEFPDTTFRDSTPDKLSAGRLLQGGALIITALGR